METDDASLVERARSGDVEAFARLVDRYRGDAMRLAYTLGGDQADDVVQEACIKAYRALGRFRAGAPFRPWLLAIVANEARNGRRRAGRQARLALRVAHLGPTGADTPDDVAVQRDGRRRLLAAVSGLRHGDREVVACRYFIGLSEAETAEALGCAPGTVKSRLSRALDRLRAELLAVDGGDRARKGAQMDGADLERRLVDLGGHLDHPGGDELGDRVRQRLAGVESPVVFGRRRARRRRRWVAAGVAGGLTVALVAACAPAREAIGRWLHIGAIELRASPGQLPDGPRPVPGSVGAPTARAISLDEVRTRVAFPIRVPDVPGGPTAIEVDERAPSGLVVLVYPSFTVVEMGGGPAGRRFSAKLLDADTLARVEHLTVGRREAWWIPDPHGITFLDGAGGLITDSVRRAGNVLIWEQDGVTYRIEGVADRQAAVRLAEGFR